MAEFPALPLFTDAYLADTRHLTAAQHGAYLLLLMMAWRTPDCALPDEDEKLARWSAMDLRAWKQNKSVILEFWKMGQDGRWRQGRLLDERKHAEVRRDQRVHAGKASALKRHDTRSTSVQRDANEFPTIPNPEPNPIEDTVTSRARDAFSIGQEIAKITGWDKSPNWTGNYSRVSGWLGEGWDPDLDILPTVERLMASKTGSPPTTLKYFERAIADAYATRMAPLPAGTPQQSTGDKKSFGNRMQNAAARGIAEYRKENPS